MKLLKFSAVAALLALSGSAFAAGFTSPTFGVLRSDNSNFDVFPVAINFTGAGGSEVAVADIIKTATLKENDILYVYDKAKGVYKTYKLTAKDDELQWVGEKSYTIDDTGNMTENEGTAPEITTVPVGASVFLKTASTNPVYTMGEVVSSLVGQSIAVSAGANLIALPYQVGGDLNDSHIQWTGVASSTIAGAVITEVGDEIRVMTSDSGMTVSERYFYNGSKWGRVVMSTETVTIGGKERSVTRSTFSTDNAVVPVGKGFWYIRQSGDMSISFTE